MRMDKEHSVRLSYGGHVLMENRNGRCVAIFITESTQVEHRAARKLLTRARHRHIHPKTLGGDKGHRVKEFVGHLREHDARPHIARLKDRKTPLGWANYPDRELPGRLAKVKARREIFGWLKTVGGLRKTRFLGQAKSQMAAFISGAVYNLLRIARLSVSGVKT